MLDATNIDVKIFDLCAQFLCIEPKNRLLQYTPTKEDEVGDPHTGTEYKIFLREICEKRGSEYYLEVGVQSGANLSSMRVEEAVGVDPAFDLKYDVTTGKKSVHLYRTTSDDYFRRYGDRVRDRGGFDLCFLDGMHLFEFLLRDFYNAEAVSRHSGLITMHDCLPFDGEMIERNYMEQNRTPGPYSTFWTGDVWKIIPILKKYRPDLRITLVDCAPTGLVCVSNLNPSCDILKKNYYEIVDEFLLMPNNEQAIEDFYNENIVTSAGRILSQYDYSLFLGN